MSNWPFLLVHKNIFVFHPHMHRLEGFGATCLSCIAAVYHCAFGCLGLHSARASANWCLNVSGHLGSRHKLLAALPKRINSSSDILRKRLRSCSSSSVDSNAMDMPVLPGRGGGGYCTPSEAMIRVASHHHEIAGEERIPRAAPFRFSAHRKVYRRIPCHTYRIGRRKVRG